MNARARLTCLLVVGLLPLSETGCIVTGSGGWPWSGPSVWTEPVTEQLRIDAANLKALEVRTHNGSISFEPQPPGTTDAYVTVTRKAGGRTQADAQEALEAIQVYVTPAGGDSQRVGWKWKGLKRPTWGARVSFDLRAPGNIRFDAKTHNGPIRINGVTGQVRVVTHNGPVKVESVDGTLHAETHNGAVEIAGMTGDVRIVTHNGPVTVESTKGKLYAETHNGRVEATYAGSNVTLVSHNGKVAADLMRCGALDGSITSHNGAVEVVIGQGTSVALKCRTHNGRIKCDVPLDDMQTSRRKLTGTIGTGQGSLEVTTHNGSVRIRKTAD